MPVAIVYPDQQPDGLGTLFIPNTLAIIKGCPHPARPRDGWSITCSRPRSKSSWPTRPSAQIPLHPEHVDVASRAKSPATVRPMQVDFAAAADALGNVARISARRIYAGP